ncbi:MAG TPA: acyl-CoA thioesterase [Armatimonadota bacterium]|nr:acyl-CoA thioesterase [Armatimonadota bacterium]
MKPNTVCASRSIISVVALPRDSNHYGYVYGGTVMSLVDQAAYAAAIRHARMPVVTVCVDHLTFLRPIHIGDVITVKASVNYAGRTSMEVGVRIETERLTTGEIEHVGSAYLTMVALDAEGKPTPIPPLQLDTEDDKRRFREAQERRKLQLARVGHPDSESTDD